MRKGDKVTVSNSEIFTLCHPIRWREMARPKHRVSNPPIGRKVSTYLTGVKRLHPEQNRLG
jgi:hypothetical protein